MPVTMPFSDADSAAAAGPGDSQTIAEAFLRNTQRYPDIVAARTLDGGVSLTWGQVGERVAVLAAGMQRLGLRRGDTCALMLKNRPEFLLADVAAMFAGAVPFSIYATLPVAQIVHELTNADARMVVCERAFLPQILAAREAYPALRTVVLLEGDGPPETVAWDSLAGAPGLDLRAAAAATRPDDLAALIYTSGTTGPAKGVELTQAGIMALCRANHEYLHFFPGQRFLSWLPTAGMSERIVSHYGGIACAGSVAFCEDTRKVAAALPDVRPHIFFAPPRFWEKIRDAVTAQWAAEPAAQRALQQAIEKVRLIQAGLPVPGALDEVCAKADREWFAPLRHRLGLDSAPISLCSGGAGAPRVLMEFFHAIGLPVDEVYGQTESSALGTRSPRGAIRIGTVGKAQPGVELKLAEDGELLLRSPAIMRGYRKQPKATAAAKDADGWLHTGDLATIDADGYVRIIGRKKEMIINSYGRNMSPVNIEGALTSAGPFIGQAVAIGDARNYNVALLTLDAVHVAAWAARQGLPTTLDALIHEPRLRAEVEAEVRLANEQLSRVEQIKKFHIVGGEWPPGAEEVTPTMKLRRHVIDHKYAAEIEAMYAADTNPSLSSK